MEYHTKKFLALLQLFVSCVGLMTDASSLPNSCSYGWVISVMELSVYFTVNVLDRRREVIETAYEEEMAFAHLSSASRVTMVFPERIVTFAYVWVMQN